MKKEKKTDRISTFIGADASIDGTIEFKGTIRVDGQVKGKIIDEIPILKGETKKVKLLKGQELYLDPNAKGMAKARVDYEKIE